MIDGCTQAPHKAPFLLLWTTQPPRTQLQPDTAQKQHLWQALLLPAAAGVGEERVRCNKATAA